jgi:hypothetical protein
MKGMVDWVWVDCFSKVPLNREIYNILKDAGFKLCFVSPELQNQPEKNQMVTYEGNTGTQGSANGDGCYKKIRPYAKVAGVGRPDWSKTK